MQLAVSAALKQPQKVFKCDMEQALPAQEYAGRTLAFEGCAQIKFDYSFDSDALVLGGHMRFAVHVECARCGKPFIETLYFPFMERFFKGEDESEAGYTFTGEFISLDTMVLDNFFLHMPLQSVCNEDCRGLCPVCGCDLNTAQCDCGPEGQENPLAALGPLFDDKEV